MVCLVFAQTRSIFCEELLTFPFFLFSRTIYVHTYNWGYSVPFQLIGSPAPQFFLIANVMINHGLWETLSDKPI
jgi:hypothetical protein